MTNLCQKLPHKGPGAVGERGRGLGGRWRLQLSIKEVGCEGRWGGAFSHFGGDKF